MKITTLNILKFGLLLILFSCGQPNDTKNTDLVTTDSTQTIYEKKEKERLKRRKEIEEENFMDSIKLDKILQDALKIANQNFSKDTFVKKYEVLLDSNPTSVEINLDYYFYQKNPHLIIRRDNSSNIYIDIYSRGKNKFEKVVSHEQWTMTYVNDTIQDINGDGLNDFVVNWYGASGCCLKAFSNIYLLRPDKKTFSDNFEFINPTFSPKEKIIRGICYGQPGETEMYKYKWVGEKVDTLEYISYQKDDNGVNTGKVIISTDQPFGDKYKIMKIVNSVPAEYRKIEGYNWFTGNFHE